MGRMNSDLMASACTEDELNQGDIIVFIGQYSSVVSGAFLAGRIIRRSSLSDHDGIRASPDRKIDRARILLIDTVTACDIFLSDLYVDHRIMDISALCNYHESACLAVKSHDRVKCLIG